MRSWRNANSILANHAMKNDWFEKKGVFDISKVQTKDFCSNILNKAIPEPYTRPVYTVP